MKKLMVCLKNRQPLSYEATQALYGISVLLTFLVAGRFAVAL